MKINIIGRQMNVYEDTKQLIEKKARKAGQVLQDRSGSNRNAEPQAQRFHTGNYNQRCEYTVPQRGGRRILPGRAG